MTSNLKKATNKFDLRKYLNSQNVDFQEYGNNVAKNNLGLNCFKCEGDSGSFHMNVHLTTKIYNCWKCNNSGNLTELIRTIEGLPRKFAKDRILKIGDYTTANDLPDDYDLRNLVEGRLKEDKEVEKEKKKKKKGIIIELPRGRKRLKKLNTDISSHNMFLKYIVDNRKYSVKTLSAWDIEALVTGMRLLFPVYFKGELVNYLTRDITGKSSRKYKNCPNDFAKVDMKSLLYGYDFIEKGQDLVVLNEGSFDTISVGKGRAVGSFSTTVTLEQQKLLMSLKPKEIGIMFDENAWNVAEKLAVQLVALPIDWNISIINVRDGFRKGYLKEPHKEIDPGSMTKKQIEKAIRKRKLI